MKDRFLLEVNDLVIELKETLNEVLLGPKFRIINLTSLLGLTPDFLEKWGLNEDIQCSVTFYGDNTAEVTFLYKNHKLTPECYYIRPDDYHDVSKLQILQQCIIQDTNTPDIKFLERGEK